MKLGFINPLNVSLNGLIDTIKVTLFVVKFDIFKFLKKYFIFLTFFLLKLYKFKFIREEQFRT